MTFSDPILNGADALVTMVPTNFVSVYAAARNSDGTTLRNLPRETVGFVVLSYRLRWR